MMLPLSKIRLRGGLHDARTYDTAIIGNRVVTPGRWEDRRLAGYDEYGIPLWSYPTEVYKPTGEYDDDGRSIWDYECTEPA